MFRDLLHAVELRHGTDGFTSPKEGVLRIFFALKFRRLRPGANPRPWLPKASTLPLDHQSRSVFSKVYTSVVRGERLDLVDQAAVEASNAYQNSFIKIQLMHITCYVTSK
jgi:hypothetical protein